MYFLTGALYSPEQNGNKRPTTSKKILDRKYFANIENPDPIFMVIVVCTINASNNLITCQDEIHQLKIKNNKKIKKTILLGTQQNDPFG